MGTTVWLDQTTRDALRLAQAEFGTSSVNATIRRLLERPALDARTLFALHGKAIQSVLAQVPSAE